MNWLDIVLALVILASTAAGLAKGFVRTVIGILATILGLFVAIWFYGAAGDIYRDYVSSKSVSNFLGFATVFLLAVLAGALIGKLLEILFKWAGMGWLDRILGACFGMLRGLVISIAIVMILMAFSLNPPPKAVAGSAIAPYVMDASRMLSKAAPYELTAGFQKSYDTLRDAAKTIGKGAAIAN
ncbi:MAG: CvpA family protein [Acidobacteria bacterium]|nr:CvpA family protein [Acidobacteriota bacterium]